MYVHRVDIECLSRDFPGEKFCSRVILRLLKRQKREREREKVVSCGAEREREREKVEDSEMKDSATFPHDAVDTERM